MIETRIRVIAVDLAGTLVQRPVRDFVVPTVKRLVEKGCSVSERDFSVAFRQRYLEYSMGNYEDDGEFFAALCASLPGVDRTLSFHEEILPLLVQSSPAFADAQPFLAAAARWKRTLASNHVASWTDMILRASGLADYLDLKLVSSNVGYRKPSRRYFNELVEVCNVPPEEILFVGDSVENDLHGARQVGLRVVLLDRARKHRPDNRVNYHVVTSLSEIVPYLIQCEANLD